MCCNGKKWVLQEVSLKTFEVILIPTDSIATYSMSAMFPDAKNRAQKLHQNTETPVSIRVSYQPTPQILQKRQLWPHVLHFSCLKECWSPGTLEKARPPLGSHSLCGKESQAPAVWDVWACPSRFLLGTPEGVAVPPFPARHRDAVLLPRGQQHRVLCPVRWAAHLSLTSRNRLFFLSTLATWNEEWTDLKDITVLGVYAKTFP